jgi:hypothetical protein
LSGQAENLPAKLVRGIRHSSAEGTQIIPSTASGRLIPVNVSL